MDTGRHDNRPASPPGAGRGGLKRFRCGDVIPGCGAAFTGTEGDILALAGQHAARDHGADVTDVALVSMVRDRMRPF